VATERRQLDIARRFYGLVAVAWLTGQSRKENAWMEDGLSQYCQTDHDAFEYNEFDLDTHELATPAAKQFRNPIRASDEDTGVGCACSTNEELEASIVPERQSIRSELGTADVCFPAIFGHEKTEYYKYYGD
jgi:hypothetical protein